MDDEKQTPVEVRARRPCGRGARRPRGDRPGDPRGQHRAAGRGRLDPRGARRRVLAAAGPLPRSTARVRNLVRQLRTEHGLSQAQLAEALDVSRQTINSIEQERYTPSLPLALALARYFGTPVEEMFDADH